METKFRVAISQIECAQGNKSSNLKKIKAEAVRAGRRNADFLIFPEMSLTGYILRDQIYELAETIPGPSTKAIEKISKDTGTHIVFGMPELSEKTQATLYNTSVLIAPEGLIGKYRKIYLPTHSVFEEKRYFRPGYEYQTLETKFGRVGMIICYDIYFPELTRLARLQGAQFIICISASPAVRRIFFETLTSARAIENDVFFAYCNLVGIEEGLQFWGGSRLIGPNGNSIVQAKYDEEDLIIGDIDLAAIRAYETFVPTLKDLRPEFYDALKLNAQKL